MEFQRQGHNECCPTTLAMLAGVPKDAVIADAARIVGLDSRAPWVVSRAQRPTNDGLNALVQCLVEKFLPMVADSKAFANRLVFSYTAITNATELSRLPRKGRGMVTINWRGHGSHVMPYENGRVLDPDGPGVPETMTQVFKRLGGQWCICRITPTEFKKEG